LSFANKIFPNFPPQTKIPAEQPSPHAFSTLSIEIAHFLSLLLSDLRTIPANFWRSEISLRDIHPLKPNFASGQQRLRVNKIRLSRPRASVYWEERELKRRGVSVGGGRTFEGETCSPAKAKAKAHNAFSQAGRSVINKGGEEDAGYSNERRAKESSRSRLVALSAGVNCVFLSICARVARCQCNKFECPSARCREPAFVHPPANWP